MGGGWDIVCRTIYPYSGAPYPRYGEKPAGRTATEHLPWVNPPLVYRIWRSCVLERIRLGKYVECQLRTSRGLPVTRSFWWSNASNLGLSSTSATQNPARRMLTYPIMSLPSLFASFIKRRQSITCLCFVAWGSESQPYYNPACADLVPR